MQVLAVFRYLSNLLGGGTKRDKLATEGRAASFGLRGLTRLVGRQLKTAYSSECLDRRRDDEAVAELEKENAPALVASFVADVPRR